MKQWFRKTTSAQRFLMLLIAAAVGLYPLTLPAANQEGWMVIFALPVLAVLFLILGGKKSTLEQ